MICLFSIILFRHKVISPQDKKDSCEKDSPYYVSYYNAFERIFNIQTTKNDKSSRLDDFSDCVVKYYVDSEAKIYKSQFDLELTRCCSRIDHPDCKKEWRMQISMCFLSTDKEIKSAANRAILRKKQKEDSPSEILKNIRKIYYGKNKEWFKIRPLSEYFHSFYEAFERYPNSSTTENYKLSDLDDFSECAVKYIISKKNFSEHEFHFELNECCNKNNDDDCKSKWIFHITNYWYKNKYVFLPAYNRAISREKDEKLIGNSVDVNLGHRRRLNYSIPFVQSDTREKI